MNVLDTSLIATAFLTSTISGVLGLGGGMILISILVQFYPPSVVIPLHGIVQLASNSSRAWVQRPHINWSITAKFGTGALLGAFAGSRLVVTLDERILQILLGVFILTATYMPKLQMRSPVRTGQWFGLGLLNAFVSLFVGANGPLLAPFFLRSALPPRAIIATEATCQTMVHGFKTALFLTIGFSIAMHLQLVVGMVVASITGSYISKFMLRRLPERHFRTLFKVLTTALAVRLIIIGFSKNISIFTLRL